MNSGDHNSASKVLFQFSNPMSGAGLKTRLEILFSDLNWTVGLLMNLVSFLIFDVKCEVVRINLGR